LIYRYLGRSTPCNVKCLISLLMLSDYSSVTAAPVTNSIHSAVCAKEYVNTTLATVALEMTQMDY
jgi:hypothetical protein